MRRVTGALRTASPGDVHAMATYVASLMPRKPPPREREPASAPREAAVFTGACAACHQAPRWAPLANSTTLAEASPRDTLEILLHGIPWRGDGLYMPPFAAMLDDAQTATLANYLRARFARQAPWNDARSEARRVRNEASDR
jgi:mono/diheme cytochrome c family protein